MIYHAIDQYFKTVAINSFEGTLQSLAQNISRHSGTIITSYNLLEYFSSNNQLYNHSVNISFIHGEAFISICENTL